MPYDELVRRLRDNEHEIDCSLCDRDCCYPDGKFHGKCIIIEAADAIEELQKRVPKSGVWREEESGYDDVYYWSYCPECGAKMTGVERLPEPPEEE